MLELKCKKTTLILKGVFKMSTCLAEVLFGHKDRDHGGIQFNSRISVYENDVTRLVFEKRASRDGNPGTIEGIWIPNPNYLIECCILMASVYGTESSILKEKLKEHLPQKEKNIDIDLCKIDETNLIGLFEEAKKAFYPSMSTNHNGHSLRWKFLFSLFFGSSLEREIKNLLKYDMDIEVLKSVFRCEYSEWSRCIETQGEL